MALAVDIDGTRYFEGVAYIDRDGDRWVMTRYPEEDGVYWDNSLQVFVAPFENFPDVLYIYGPFRRADGGPLVTNLEVAP